MLGTNHPKDFENLPTESLIRIFKFLPSRDLLNASQTCRKFNQIIMDFMPIKYPSIRIDFQYLNYSKIQKFTYKIRSNEERDFNCLIETTRHYQNYILVNFNKEHTDRLGNKWLMLFKKQINARCIRIKSDCMDLQQLSNLVKLTHRLVYMEIDGYRIAAKMDEPLDESDRAHLPSLKHLKIHSFLDTSTQIFKIFHDCKQLQTISLSSLFFINKKIKSINDFILQQRLLEQLELIGLDSHNALFEPSSHQHAKFKLKKINCDYNGYSFNLDNFTTIFLSQRSFREVKLAIDLRNSVNHDHDEKLCDSMIRHTMTSCPHLTSLNLLINKFTLRETETFVYNNNSITKLVFENESRGSNELLVPLLRSLPNLIHLELAGDYSDDLLEILPTLINLNHLKITDYYQGLLKKVRCVDTLESISLQYCYAKNTGSDWLEFLQNHPKIKKIHVHHTIDFIDDAIVDIITVGAPYLESFRMTDSTSKTLTENAYKIFEKNCKNLKTLKLVERVAKSNENKHQSLHDFLANVQCVIGFYLICIFGFIVLVVLMIMGTI
jgi:hypothetical protein